MDDLVPDVNRVRSFLGEWCADGSRVDRLELTYLKLAPGEPAAEEKPGAGLFLFEADGPAGETLRLFARRVGEEAGAARAADLNRRFATLSSERIGGFRQPAMYSVDLGLLFHVFPADSCLPSLARAADPRIMAPIVYPHEPVADPPPVAVRAIRYKPERKCVFRYDIAPPGGAAGLAENVLYGKVQTPERSAGALDALTAIREARRDLPFDLPRPIAEVPDLSLQLFSRVPGVPLTHASVEEQFADLCRLAAGAHARFHALPVNFLRRQDPAANAERLAKAERDLGLLLPSHARWVHGLGRVLSSRLSDATPATLLPIHGDFHADNVLVDGDRLGLVDLEDCAMGVPADDAGSMWAQLTWLSIKPDAPGRVIETGRNAFLEEFLEQAAARTRRRLPVHAALHCFLFARQCVRHSRGRARREQALALLARCEAALAGELRT
jgi:hypothetical protein